MNAVLRGDGEWILRGGELPPPLDAMACSQRRKLWWAQRGGGGRGRWEEWEGEGKMAGGGGGGKVGKGGN